MRDVTTLYEFIEKDNYKTLFPTNSIKVFSKYGLEEIIKFINEDILKKKEEISQAYFLAQPWVYASKDRFHLRQTFQLDPIAQIFLYDFVFRNKNYFITTKLSGRESFGYSFNEDTNNSPSEDYKKFSEKLIELKRKYNFYGKIDISNCFNNIYHHDVVSFIARLINQVESAKLGTFLTQINEGRSTSCMPQGLFPAKVIGNFFLSFVESSRELNSEFVIRFMDDIYFFSDSRAKIVDDIFIIQKLIGEKGLALNEEKTFIQKIDDNEEYIGDMKQTLLDKRRSVINTYTIDEFDDDESENRIVLSDDEIEYLTQMLHEKNLEEKDIELILTLLSAGEEDLLYLMEVVLNDSPHLMNKLYLNLSRNNVLSFKAIELIEKYLDNNNIQEFVLFWLCKIVTDLTVINEYTADILFKIYKHTSITNVVKCLILELQDNNYGFLELKRKITRGHSPELIISAMVGLISHEKGNRNKIYGYVGRTHPMMRILTKVLSRLEPHDVENLFRNDEQRFEYTNNGSDELNPFIIHQEETSGGIIIDDDDLPF
ncbi:reverse transcriptase domain-containing protein [Paenibacillus polymyxa]|uniref:reverse transcriptase domain-containing protein n=1 Tax=Paenibacillus polymyxa TaxID=1406 RepID=UPI002AB4C0D4|nr:reverse transcriptase domain-containing protein [Paenibacillus polymyxa]MDY8045904.1 reverse transcriptase domain-containing protein [Paenibacillus polymyxa]